MEEKKSTTRAQSEWYAAALQASDTIFSKQRELFGDMTDTCFYSTEVTRFDDFVKVGVFVDTKHYNQSNQAAVMVAEYVNSVSDSILLTDYTGDEDLDFFVDKLTKTMEMYANTVRNIINSLKK